MTLIEGEVCVAGRLKVGRYVFEKEVRSLSVGIRMRVRVRFPLTGKVIETVALVNSGAESERQCAVVGGEAGLLSVKSPEVYGAV